MKNSITTKTTGTMAGSVFFGSAEMILDHQPLKRHRFTVSSHLEIGKEYEFRAIGKVKAGWNSIFDFKCKAEGLWYHIGKSTQLVEVKTTHKHGVTWLPVYTTKGGLWAIIDTLLLDIATVGDIRQSAPKMASYQTWNKMEAKTWADLAFVQNKGSKKSSKSFSWAA
jgi:hypothetical protein